MTTHDNQLDRYRDFEFMLEPLVDLNLHNVQYHDTNKGDNQGRHVSVFDSLKYIDVRLEVQNYNIYEYQIDKKINNNNIRNNRLNEYENIILNERCLW